MQNRNTKGLMLFYSIHCTATTKHQWIIIQWMLIKMGTAFSKKTVIQPHHLSWQITYSWVNCGSKLWPSHEIEILYDLNGTASQEKNHHHCKLTVIAPNTTNYSWGQRNRRLPSIEPRMKQIKRPKTKSLLQRNNQQRATQIKPH